MKMVNFDFFRWLPGLFRGCCLMFLLTLPGFSVAGQDVSLERQINNYIQKLRRDGVLGYRERTAWLVTDLTSGKKYVSINERVPYQSASMIKPFIALAFFSEVKKGRFYYGHRARRKMVAMIQNSNNRATNYFIDLLAREKDRINPRRVEQILKQRYPEIFKDILIVERIPSDGRTYRNKASARDYNRFLQAVWFNRVPYSGELKRLMGLPNKDRIRSTQHSRKTRILDKTGTTAMLCGEMGIIVGKGRNGRLYPYIFVAIIERSARSGYRRWSKWRSRIIRKVSALVHRDMQRRYSLI